MRLSRPFIRLPWNFDASRLADEIADIPDHAWMAHPSRLQGNTAVALISNDGGDNDDFAGCMCETPHLAGRGYLRRVLASFDMVIGRSRLMKLAAGAEVSTHVDFNYHWYSRVRIHIPITSNSNVTFYCGNEQLHMATGESWIFDSWRRHRVTNDGSEDRIHLVIDTSGSSEFWHAARAMEAMEPTCWDEASSEVNLDSAAAHIRCKQYNIAPVMAPGEMLELAQDLIADFSANTSNAPQLVSRYRRLLLDLCADWRQLWLQFGTDSAGRKHYQGLLDDVATQLDPDRRALLTASNNIGVNPVIMQRILRAALAISK